MYYTGLDVKMKVTHGQMHVHCIYTAIIPKLSWFNSNQLLHMNAMQRSISIEPNVRHSSRKGEVGEQNELHDSV